MALSVREKTRLDSMRCSHIRNKNTDAVFERCLDPLARWAEAYDRAIMMPDEFEVVYDAALAAQATDSYVYTDAELRPLSMPELKQIGLERGATGKNKPDLIKNILAAQGNSVETGMSEEAKKKG